MSRFKKTDKNQQAIVEKLRQAGFSVWPTHTLGRGFPDLIVGKDGINLLIELKTKGSSGLRSDQQKFFVEWRGHVAMAYTFDDIVKAYDSHVRYLKTVLENNQNDRK